MIDDLNFMEMHDGILMLHSDHFESPLHMGPPSQEELADIIKGMAPY